jgi:Ca2+-binding RTX toxin-like protein
MSASRPRTTRRAQGIAVALAVIVGIALASGGVVVLAGSGSEGASTGSEIVGTNGPDRLIGTSRHDVIDGRGGADLIRGRGGSDVLKGGTGRDEIAGGEKFDRLLGGPGDDTIRARDRHADTIECGAGRDVAWVDRIEDGVYDCKVVRTPGPSHARPAR